LKSLPFESGDCGKTKYSMLDQNKIAVTNTDYIFEEDRFEQADGEGRRKDGSGNGRLQIRFSRF